MRTVTLALLMLTACEWLEPAQPTLSTEGLDPEVASVVEALHREIRDLQDRVTELEAADCLSIADLPAELDAYVTQPELDGRLGGMLEHEDLDALLEEIAFKEDVPAAISEHPAVRDLEARMRQQPTAGEVDAALRDRPTHRELVEALGAHPTHAEVERQHDGLASRDWVEDQLRRYELLLVQGLVGQPNRSGRDWR